MSMDVGERLEALSAIDTVSVTSPLFGSYGFSSEDNVRGMVARAIVTPIGIRGSDVTLQSTTPEYAAQPYQAEPHRLGHVSDVVHMLIELGRRENMPAEELLALVVKVGLSDLAHPPFAHVGEWVIEGVGGDETYHEDRAPGMLAAGGLYKALQWDRLPSGLEVPGWAEDPGRGINPDRIQYAVYETISKLRDVEGAQQFLDDLRAVCQLDNFEIVDDKLVFKKPADALLFSKAYLLLSESWNSPLKRTADTLLVHAMKSAIVQRLLPNIAQIDGGVPCHPADYLYGTDSDMVAAFRSPNASPELATIDRLLKQLGSEGRSAFDTAVADDISFLSDENATELPAQSRALGFGSLAVREARSGLRAPGEILLSAPKYRTLDPYVKADDGIKPLSRVNEKYAELLRRHEERYTKDWIGTLNLDSEQWANLLRASATSEEFDKLLVDANRNTDSRMKPEQIQAYIKLAGQHALARGLSTQHIQLRDNVLDLKLVVS